MANDLIVLIDKNPLIVLMFCLLVGYYLGKIKLGHFTIGATIGVLGISLFMGRFFNYSKNDLLGNLFFCFFMYAVGYRIGPEFLTSIKKIGMKVVYIAIGFFTVALIVGLGLAKMFKLSPGIMAGIFAGSLTQSAVIGSSMETIAQLPISNHLKELYISQIPVAYVITYVFGTIGVIFFLRAFLPAVMKLDLKQQAIKQSQKIYQTIPINKRQSIKITDISYVWLFLGLLASLLLGMLKITINHIPIALGSGTASLIIGLLQSAYADRRQLKVNIPSALLVFMQSFGLNVFIANVGLSSAKNFAQAFHSMGLSVLVIGMLVSILPILIVFIVAYYLFKIEPVMLIAALAGSDTLSAVLNDLSVELESKEATAYVAACFAPAYAIGNILITLLGPLVLMIM